MRVAEHLELSFLAVLFAVLIALPFGLWSGHTGRGGFIAVSLANIGRALPSLALLAFALPVAIALGLGLGFWPTLIALVPLGIPPILTNSYVECARRRGRRPRGGPRHGHERAGGA